MEFGGASFIVIGIFGLLAGTVGTTGLARVFANFRPKRKNKKSARALCIDLLVAVHNEEKLIAETISSLKRAKAHFLKTDGSAHIGMIVGLDHCTDGTEAVLHSMKSGAEILHNHGPQGKWNLIQHLVSESQADWVALVDSGSIWDEKLLFDAYITLSNEDVIGVAPSYQASNASFVEKLNWHLERFLKSLESNSGGPTSVHGATVLYRRKFLIKALQTLSLNSWLNDDVVIPLTLRTRFPNHRIVYLAKPSGAYVSDIGIAPADHNEQGRRRRMLIGNLQWIQALYPKALASDWSVAMIASRRVFRTFWAYSVSSIALGLIFLATAHFEPSIITGAILSSILAISFFMPLGAGLQKIRTAFRAGLEIPFHWIDATKSTSEKIWN